jgi:hypothetical protein
MTTEITRYAYVSQGQQSKMYTLWVDHLNGSEFVKPRYVKNLSTNKDKALEMGMLYASNCNIQFFDDSMDELRKIKRIHKWTDTMVRFGKNYGTELRDCEPKFIVWIAKGSPLKNEHSGEWSNNYFGGQEFCEIAQEIAVEMGLGKIENRLNNNSWFVTNEKYDQTTELLKKKAEEKNDHHYTNGQRLELTLTFLKRTGYESDYGFINIYNFQDAYKNIFTYKGTSHPFYKYVQWNEIVDGVEHSGRDILDLEINDTITFTATIKHSEYKGQKQTFIQRIKIK